MRLNSPKMNVIANACLKASKSLIRDFGEIENLQVSSKGPGDFVSSADKRTEKILIEELQKAHPNFGIITEEAGVINQSNIENRWIIDPIDGTMNFLNGIPQFAISVGYVQVRFGSSYFDVQLLNRGVDISDGRTGLFMNETDILRFADKDFSTIKENATIDDATLLMSKINQSELLVENEAGEFIGKIMALSLFNKKGKLSSSNVIDKDCVFIDHDASLQSAMEVASNFVGEIIPIIDTDRKKAIAVITEGAIFQAYLSKQNQTVETEKR